jgi:hypothetical protein
MKRVLPFMFLLYGCCAWAQQPSVSECFKVHSLIKMDGDHYWAKWANACPYTIDSVYVLVGFMDKARKIVGNGVWGLHYITPGQGRVTRFSTPPNVSNYEIVNVRKITTDSEEALH